MSLLAHAMQYADLGWHVLPLHNISNGSCTCGKATCSSPGKHPRTSHGLKDATADPKIIEGWWTKWPDANIGIRTGDVSGIVAVDIDPRHGGDKTLADLLAEHGDLPETVTASTGGGGLHFIFAWPGESIRSRSGVLPGIDVRGESGYIVVAPSNHLSGNLYAWADGLGPEDVNPADMPGWLLDLVKVGDVTERAERSERTEAPISSVLSALSVTGAGKISEIIASTLPTGPGQRHRCVFELCRALKAEPAYADADPQQLRPIVVEWHRRALPVILTKALEESWCDFLQAWPKVRYPKGAGPMDAILDSARAAAPPPEALRYEQAALRLLVSICRLLQERAGEGPFFLGCRTAGRLLGVDHVTAWRWLFLLQADGILAIAEQGTKRRAARYLFRQTAAKIEPETP